jgi:hypothetical protein
MTCPASPRDSISGTLPLYFRLGFKETIVLVARLKVNPINLAVLLGKGILDVAYTTMVPGITLPA